MKCANLAFEVMQSTVKSGGAGPQKVAAVKIAAVWAARERGVAEEHCRPPVSVHATLRPPPALRQLRRLAVMPF